MLFVIELFNWVDYYFVISHYLYKENNVYIVKGVCFNPGNVVCFPSFLAASHISKCKI